MMLKRSKESAGLKCLEEQRNTWRFRITLGRWHYTVCRLTMSRMPFATIWAGRTSSERLSKQTNGVRMSEYHCSFPLKERKRSEEHTSELQSRQYLVCRLLLEKK